MRICLVWGRDSCATSPARLAGRLHVASYPGYIAGFMYNARRNPRSLQYYSQVDVPLTAIPQRLREGDDLQERCVLGSRGVRPHPTNPPWLRPCSDVIATLPTCKPLYKHVGDYMHGCYTVCDGIHYRGTVTFRSIPTIVYIVLKMCCWLPKEE